MFNYLFTTEILIYNFRRFILQDIHSGARNTEEMNRHEFFSNFHEKHRFNGQQCKNVRTVYRKQKNKKKK